MDCLASRDLCSGDPATQRELVSNDSSYDKIEIML